MPQPKTWFERPMLRMGSIAFIAGFVIFFVSTMLHPSGEDPTYHPLVFAEYAKDDLWIASHVGQFAGGIVIFAGGFVALYRLLVQSESGAVSTLAWIGLAVTILAASSLSILQTVDGIALKRAVDSWAAAPVEEKDAAFQVAEGIRWTEIGANSILRILQGIVGVIYGVAIAMSALLSRWIGAVGVFAGVTTIILGVNVAYVGFGTVHSPVETASIVSYLGWLVILGIFIWRNTISKTVTAR